ncbi:MAG: FAD-binding protein, partial [Alphaproteobacteria bacterium]|nr:FAD-binding protein [Alphaproteobacteria bacterium]
GRAIMEQPHRWCAQIFDAKTVHMLRDEYRIREITKVEADSIEELAAGLEIDPAGLAKTVGEFNAACRSSNAYNPAVLDGVSTEGLSPEKTNWALPIDRPPYVAFVTTTGITFTFGGLQIDNENRVQDLSGRPIDGLYAAGELVGGLFFENYPGGSGLMSGSVFGRRAGRFAAEYACG